MIKKKEVSLHVNVAWWRHWHARSSACCGVPFLCSRPSALPPELAWNRSPSVVTARPPELFRVWLVPERRVECIVCVFDAWECPGTTATGEGRSRCLLVPLVPLLRPLAPVSPSVFSVQPGPTTALLPPEVKKKGSVGLANFKRYQTRRGFPRRLS